MVLLAVELWQVAPSVHPSVCLSVHPSVRPSKCKCNCKCKYKWKYQYKYKCNSIFKPASTPNNNCAHHPASIKPRCAHSCTLARHTVNLLAELGAWHWQVACDPGSHCLGTSCHLQFSSSCMYAFRALHVTRQVGRDSATGSNQRHLRFFWESIQSQANNQVGKQTGTRRMNHTNIVCSKADLFQSMKNTMHS